MFSDNLLGKVVSVESPYELEFYLVGFSVVEDLAESSGKIIYNGVLSSSIQNKLRSRVAVLTKGFYDYNLKDRKAKLVYIMSKFGREPSKSLLDTIQLYDDEDFNYIAKYYWVTGRLQKGVVESEEIYSLYKALVGPYQQLLVILYQLIETQSGGYVESAILTFIKRAQDVENQNVSPYYKRLLYSFNRQCGSKFKSALLTYAKSPINNLQLKLFNLISDLRGV